MQHLEARGPASIASDAIVYGGGTQFFAFDHDLPPAPDPIAIRALRKLARPLSLVDSLRARCRIRREARTPRLAIGLGVGPFPPESKVEATVANLLRGMELVWVRDDASMAFCRRHAVDGALRSADLCFTMAFAASVRAPDASVNHTRGQIDARRRVGIVLRDWKGWKDDYFDAALEAARRLRARKIEPTFFSLASSDRRLLTTLGGADFPVVAWWCTPGELESFWSELARMDFVLTARFHGAVFALLSGVPFVAIGIEPKLEQVQCWATADEQPKLTMPAEADPDLIVRHVVDGLNQASCRRDAARLMLAEQRRLAAIGEQRLTAWFEKGRDSCVCK
jgi:polysaccharide pyruvyl transferase WcaK-like protein